MIRTARRKPGDNDDARLLGKSREWQVVGVTDVGHADAADDDLQLGLVERPRSPWSSQFHLKWSVGGIEHCVDFDPWYCVSSVSTFSVSTASIFERL